MYLPTTPEEIKELGWDHLDIILVSGDTYIDSPYIGIAVIGHILLDAGFKVGVIAQPDVSSEKDITRLGEPDLFWGVSAGSIDSMVANYTASRKKRRQDDYTPGGENTKRPDRALISYTNLIKRYHKNSKPIILGGLEASLRRLAHYDYWSDKIRRSVLLDSKADFLVYGMAERTIIEIAHHLKNGEQPFSVRGLCYLSKEPVQDYVLLPSYETVLEDKLKFIEAFHLFYKNNDPITAKGLMQAYDNRYLIQNPPAVYLNQKELDHVYQLPFERNVHPFYEKMGSVKALETIRFSINTHRGCYGECNFCAIAVHEGRTIRWRSEESILHEANQLTNLKGFKGYIHDLGGPTANMYGFECSKKLKKGACDHRRCLVPVICSGLRPTHKPQIDLLRKLREIKGIKKVFVASGIRYDMILNDKRYGKSYLNEIVDHHISGQLKIAPEHTNKDVLEKMGKPGTKDLLEFKSRFDELNKQKGKQQFLTYYFIAAHPGCSDREMEEARKFAIRELKILPEQVQIFTPTPSTYASLMYYTELDPFSLEPIFVEKDLSRKNKQKQLLVPQKNGKKP